MTFLASERVWCSHGSYHMTTTFNHKLTSSAIFQRHSAARPAAIAGCPIWTSAHSSRVVPGPSATRSFEHLKDAETKQTGPVTINKRGQTTIARDEPVHEDPSFSYTEICYFARSFYNHIRDTRQNYEKNTQRSRKEV